MPPPRSPALCRQPSCASSSELPLQRPAEACAKHCPGPLSAPEATCCSWNLLSASTCYLSRSLEGCTHLHPFDSDFGAFNTPGLHPPCPERKPLTLPGSQKPVPLPCSSAPCKQPSCASSSELPLQRPAEAGAKHCPAPLSTPKAPACSCDLLSSSTCSLPRPLEGCTHLFTSDSNFGASASGSPGQLPKAPKATRGRKARRELCWLNQESRLAPLRPHGCR